MFSCKKFRLPIINKANNWPSLPNFIEIDFSYSTECKNPSSNNGSSTNWFYWIGGISCVLICCAGIGFGGWKYK